MVSLVSRVHRFASGGGFRRTRLAYVTMAAEVLEQLDFAQCALGKNLLAEDIGDFLNGDSFIALVVDSSAARRNSLARSSADSFRDAG